MEIVKLDNIKYQLFSATINNGVEQLSNEINPVKVLIGGKNNVLNTIEQKLMYTGSEYGKMLEIKNIINSGNFTPPVLIFVQSKPRAEELLAELKSQTHIKVDSIHSDKSA